MSQPVMFHLLAIGICVLLLFTGCSQYQDLKDKYFGIVVNDTNTSTKLICPVLDYGQKLDAVLYYFDDDVDTGIHTFLLNGNDYIYCAMSKLETPAFNEHFLSQASTFDLKLIFDKRSTMDCSAACIPYPVSQYIVLYANNVNIRLSNEMRENFCISEDGVFIFSKTYDNITGAHQHAMLLKSDDLLDIFGNRFDLLWEGAQ